MSTKGKSAVPTRKEKKARASLSDNRMVSGLTSTRASRRRTGTVQRERIVSKKSKSRTGGKGKLAGEAKHGLLTCDRIVENPERKWRLALAPNETVMVAEDAPPVQMVIQNVGPAVFEVTVENSEPVVLMTGKLTVMHAYGRIAIENFDDYPGIAEMEFLPRSKS
jgi:hypothetical protein